MHGSKRLSKWHSIAPGGMGTAQRTPESSKRPWGWQHLWQRVRPYLQDQAPDVHVWHHREPSGDVLWSGYDAATGRSIEQVPEMQMRQWLEQRHLSPAKCR